jgi:hypothetical protein
MGAGFGDDRAAVGVPDQDGGTVEAVEDQVGRGNVAGQRQGRVLHDGYAVAVGGQVVVDPLPAGAVDEPAVHQHDVLQFLTCVHGTASFAQDQGPGSMGYLRNARGAAAGIDCAK